MAKTVVNPRAAARPAPPVNPKPRTREPEQQASGPVAHVKAYPVSGSIWMRYTSNGQPMYNASFQKIYKDSNGAWQYTNSFSDHDLLTLAHAATEAYRVIQSMRRNDREDSRVHREALDQEVTDDDVPF